MQQNPLGETVEYNAGYNPDILFPIERALKRQAIGIDAKLPFNGMDVWNAYELSWLNNKGKPIAATAQFIIPANSPFLIESKSLKLYLNMFNGTTFNTVDDVKKTIEKDLSQHAGAEVDIIINNELDASPNISTINGICLDQQDIACDTYELDSSLLTHEAHIISETLYSNLLRSKCPVTGQPDWGTIVIKYHGYKLNQANLLQYIVSLRNHEDYHEQCVERIFMDISRLIKPNDLTVFACYTRRGGIDINPYRTTADKLPTEIPRLFRQ